MYKLHIGNVVSENNGVIPEELVSIRNYIKYVNYIETAFKFQSKS